MICDTLIDLAINFIYENRLYVNLNKNVNIQIWFYIFATAKWENKELIHNGTIILEHTQNNGLKYNRKVFQKKTKLVLYALLDSLIDWKYYWVGLL